MKNILQIALAVVFVLSGVAVSTAQISPTLTPSKIIILPSGRVLIIRPPAPAVPPLKLPTIGNSLPPWATKLSVPITLPPPTIFTPFKPFTFVNSLPKKVEPFKDLNKTFSDLQRIQMANAVRNGVVGLIVEQQIKDRKKQEAKQFISSPNLTLGSLPLSEPQVKSANKNSAPVVVVTSNLPQSALTQVSSSPTLQPTNSGLTTNSSLKVVYVTADGTAILTDGHDNYYSLPPNAAGNKQGKASETNNTSVEKKPYSRRSRSRSRN